MHLEFIVGLNIISSNYNITSTNKMKVMMFWGSVTLRMKFVCGKSINKLEILSWKEIVAYFVEEIVRSKYVNFRWFRRLHTEYLKTKLGGTK